MQEKAKKILKRYSAAKATADKWRPQLEEVYEYCVPNRNIFSSFQPGAKKNNKIFDSTPEIAVNKYVSRLQNLLVRPWTNWFTLTSGTSIPDEKKEELDKYLQKTSTIIMDAINHSNFSTQIAEAFTDLACSTGVIMVNEDVNPNSDSDIIFKSVPLPHIAIETAASGDIKTVFRAFSIPLNQIQVTWRKAKLTPEMIESYDEDPTAPQDIIECTIYNESTFKYEFVVMTASAKILLEETIDESPFIVFRESVVPGESFGRGRLMTVISDIKRLNMLAELELKSGMLSVAGVFTATDDGIINVKNIRLEPGAIIPVGSNSNTEPTIKPLHSATDFNVSEMLTKEIASRINEHLLVQPFGNINDTSVRSATEMNIRQNDFIQTSVASFSRLQTELLSPIVNKVIYILKKNGKIDDLKIDGKEIKVKYSSPVAKMEGIEEIQAYQQFMEMMQTIPPETLQAAVKFDSIPPMIADALNMDKSILRTPEEQKELVEEATKMNSMLQSQQMEMQQIQSAPPEQPQG